MFHVGNSLVSMLVPLANMRGARTVKKALIIGAVVIVAIGVAGVRIVTGQTEIAEADAARRSLLGVAARDVTDADIAADARLSEGAGVLVTAVQAYGLAEAAGLASGDLITRIGGAPVPTATEYHAALDSSLAAGTVTFAVRRAGADIEVRVAPGMAVMYNGLGIAYVKDGRSDAAKTAFIRALQLEPEFAEAHYNLANLHADAGDRAAAIASFSAAVEHNESFREARYRLAEMHAEAGSYELAMTELKRAAGLEPEPTAERDLRPVETVLATRGDIQREIATSGTIGAVADVSVFAKMPGRIEELLVEEGQRVEIDDIVAVLEHEELQLQALQAEAAAGAAVAAHEQVKQLAEVRVRAQAAQAAAGLLAAGAALKLVEDLAETRATSQTDQAEAGLAAIQANLTKLRRGLRDEELAQVRAALSQALASREDARRNAARMQTLFDNGAISRQTLDSAGTLLDVAKAQHRMAREQLTMAETGSREEDILSLEAQARQAEAGVAIARKQAESRTWQSDIAMAAAQVEQARANDTTARSLIDAESWSAEITAAAAAATQAQAALALAEKRLDDAFIKAPIAGTIARRNVDPGDMANPAAPLLDIVQMDTVRATVRVLEGDLANLHVGGAAGVLLQTLPAPVAASITRISPTVDPASRTAEVVIEMPNTDGSARPGMFARVSFPIDVRRNAILLPRDTVVADTAGGGSYVYTVAQGRARRAPIQQGLTEGRSVQVAAGLDAGAEVVYSGRQSLREGDFVKVVRRVDAW